MGSVPKRLLPLQGLFCTKFNQIPKKYSGRRRNGALHPGCSATWRREIFKLAVLTISDTGASGERAEDASGDAISRIMAGGDFREVHREVVADDKQAIAAKLSDWCDGGGVDLVLTTGGTGLGPRDVTPEAMRDVIHLEVPGFSEAMRVQTMVHTPFAILSRGLAGVRNGCLIVNLPGSPSGVEQCLEVIGPALPHGLEMINGWRTHTAP